MHSLLMLTAVNEVPCVLVPKSQVKSYEEHMGFICVPEFLSQFAAMTLV